jgi:hemoglobin
MPQPYKSTPVFDEDSLPDAIRSEHRTKPGAWGLLRVLAGRATLVFVEPRSEVEVTPDTPAEIPPQATHFVRLDGPARLRIEFYREPPLGE